MGDARGWAQELVAPSGAEAGYLTGVQISELMHDAAMAYLGAALDLAVLEDIGEMAVRPLLRGMTSQFEAPLPSEQPIRIAVGVESRSERSFVLAQSVHLAADDRLVATGTASLVMVDAATHRSTAVPEEVWARIAELDRAGNVS